MVKTWVHGSIKTYSRQNNKFLIYYINIKASKTTEQAYNVGKIALDRAITQNLEFSSVTHNFPLVCIDCKH